MSSFKETSSSSAPPAILPIDILGDDEGKKWKLGKATKLMIAAASGSKRTFDKVLREGAHVDVVNEFGFNAMHFAAKASNDNSEVIRELHHQGLSVRIESNGGKIDGVMYSDGFTPLHIVENAGSATTLIELGADPDKFGISPQGMARGTCVFMSATSGNAAVLRAMLAAGGTLNPHYCWYAAQQGKASTVKVMLEHGHFNLAYVKETTIIDSILMIGRKYYPYDIKKTTIAQAAFCAGHNKTVRKNCDEIIKMLEEAGAPDEVAEAPGKVYGKGYTR
jgi:ankyrin repeat protein